MKKLLTLTAASTVLLSANAMAAGFHLREQSTAAQGNAFAGATAGAEDNTYSYYNAAGLTRHTGTQFSFGGTYIAPKAEAKQVSSQNGQRDADVQNVVHSAVSPNFTLSHQLNDKWFVALAGNSPFGMITKYDKDWVGSDHGITSDVKTATISPMAAYKVTDKLSFGTGIQAQYLWAHLTNSHKTSHTAHVNSNGHAWDFGYQLGMLYELNKDTRFGVGYRSEIKHKIKGTMRSSGSALSGSPDPRIAASGMGADVLMNQEISVKLTTPSMLSFGAYHNINDRWSVMAEYQRVFWSSLQNLTFVSRDGKNVPGLGYVSKINESWRDTNFFAVGTSVKLDDQWKWRLGLAYDQSAVRYAHRTPRVPDSDRYWVSTGLSYQYNDNLSFSAAYTHIFAKSAMLDTSLTGNAGENVTAKYSNSVQVFALGVTYNF